jgi:class 3 adenylate cyclase/tetratricopeptide (TPR) repeat protein
MKCPRCGFDNADGINFCGQCGERLRATCSSCGAAGQATKSPCTACGHVPEEPQPATARESEPVKCTASDDIAVIRRFLTPKLAEKILAARGRIEGERRQVTALFADIQGYTPLSEQLGEEATFKVMERIYECMITAVLAEEGSVQELTGDGVFALFGAPIALEDAPVRACRAALEIQKMMLSLDEELHTVRGIRPLARIGIHTGPVVIGTLGTDLRMEFKAVGDTVNLASRLESMAEPGHIFISEATFNLVAPFIDCLCLGERPVKGKAELQRVYHLEGIKEQTLRFEASLHRGLTPLAGRSEELDLLEHYCDKAGQGSTLLALIIGEAGVGKSRLLYELKRRVENRRFLFLQSNCTSFGASTPLLPFMHLVNSLFRINDGDDRTVVERKMKQSLELFGMAAEAKPFLMALLGFEERDNSLRGLDAKIVGDRTREILVELIRNRCLTSPMIVAIEDLHWIDPASENLLDRIVRSVDKSPLFILCTARPSYAPRWRDAAHFREVQLAPLSRQCTIDMAKSLLGCDIIDDGLSRVIVEETGCNPLYTEEMTRYLLDSGAIQRAGRTVSCAFAPDEVKVPSTILDLLQTRVDRLEEGPKALLQTAAVIGQRFSPDIARPVSGLGESFDSHLCELEKLRLVFREQFEEQVVYRFKHALLQDAVYNSLLKERRVRLHQLVAETMEQLYTDRLNEWANTLAHHWGNTHNTCKTVQYLVMAGEKSYWVCSLDEAHQRFRRAVELIEAEPGCVDDLSLADVLVKWAQVFVYRADFKGMTRLLEHYLPRMETLGDKRRLSLFLTWLADSHVFAGRGEKAKPLVERALALAEESGDPECIGHAARVLAWLYSYWIPDSAQSEAMIERYYEHALECAEKTNDIVIFLQVTLAMAVHLFMRGRFTRSRFYCCKLMELGRRFRDNRFLSHAQWALGFINLNEERYEEALENAEQALQLSPDLLDDLCAKAVKAGALGCTGKISEGFALLSTVRHDILEHEFVLLLAGVDMGYGSSLALAGRISEGVKHLKDAIRYWRSLGNYTEPVWGHEYLGEIYLQLALGTYRPPFGVILTNIWFLLKNLPVAHHAAHQHFEEVARSARAYEMPGYLAKALYNLGLLSRAKKDFRKARSFFEEALQVAEISELFIAGKIRQEIDSLEKSADGTVRE